MVHHKATSDKSHHKANKDDDSPHQLHERLTIDEIMHKEFGYAEEYKDVNQKIQEVEEMDSEDKAEFITLGASLHKKEFIQTKRGNAYDNAMKEILNGRTIPEVHNAVVDQEEAERERLACEKRE